MGNNLVIFVLAVTCLLVCITHSAFGDSSALINEMNQLCKGSSPNDPFCKNFKNDYYQTTGFILTHNPVTICATEVKDPSFTNIKQKTFGLTEGAVQDWQSNLNGILAINYVEIPATHTNSSYYENCDVKISYKPQPDPNVSINNEEPIGVTYYDSGNHKASIQIFYDFVDYQTIAKPVTIGGQEYEQYTSTGYYKAQIASDAQLEFALRHELGHAFGLGHYVASEIQPWTAGGQLENIPSLMIPEVGPIDYSQAGHINVKQQDIQQMKLIYQNTPSQNKQINPNENNPFFLRTDFQIGIQNDIGYNGKVSWNTLSRLIGYFGENGNVIKSSGMTHMNKPIPNWFNDVLNWWSQDKISDQDMISDIRYLIDNNILDW